MTKKLAGGVARARLPQPEFLECPCCGDDGAQSDADGYFMDGQTLICGCSGWVSVSADDRPWINNGDQPCPAHAKCQLGAKREISQQ
jgi:hypothetical protein